MADDRCLLDCGLPRFEGRLGDSLLARCWVVRITVRSRRVSMLGPDFRDSLMIGPDRSGWRNCCSEWVLLDRRLGWCGRCHGCCSGCYLLPAGCRSVGISGHWMLPPAASTVIAGADLLLVDDGVEDGLEVELGSMILEVVSCCDCCHVMNGRGFPDLARRCRPDVELTLIVGLLERGLLGGFWMDDCCIACSAAGCWPSSGFWVFFCRQWSDFKGPPSDLGGRCSLAVEEDGRHGQG
ncbi:hypothetical protein ACLOJK_023063 [Asimina triloba]